MNVSPDQVRAAARRAAAVISPESVPPLRLDQAPRGTQPRPRPGARARRAWAAPLAAAAAVIIVAAAGVTATSLLGRPAPPRPGTSVAPARGTPAGVPAGVPPYYVMVANSSLTVVRATWTGATLATITTSTPVAGVAGAADGRTFVLDEQRQIIGSSVTWAGQPAFYLLRLTASGTEQSLTRLPVPAIPAGTVVAGLALSPDGSTLAINADTSSWPPAPGDFMEIITYTLATGASRSWTTHGMTNDRAPNGFTGSGTDGAQSISWTADSRTLAFGVLKQSIEEDMRLLDTTAAGSDLMTDSRLAVVIRPPLRDQIRILRNAAPPDYFASCSTAAMISTDGSTIICAYSTTVGNGTTMGFAQYSTRTGKMTHVIGLIHFEGDSPTGQSLYWVNSTGNVAIGVSETTHGGRIGVMNGNTFTPLPGVGGFATIAW